MKEFVPIELVDAGYRDCCRRKSSTRGCAEYKMDYILNNLRLYKELNTMTYEIGKSKAFCVTRPKIREVFCAQFRDRVVHHILAVKFLRILETGMTDNAYACRKEKGINYGVSDISRQIERVTEGYTRESWILKGDLSGFFMSVDRQMLYGIVEDVIRRQYNEADIERWLWLWRKVIMHDPTHNCVKVGDTELWEKLPKNKSLFTCGKGKGLAIGNLPSQILANLLMAKFDKWVLRRIGCNGGYGRYVDDFVVISREKEKLLSLIFDARIFLGDELGLTLHPQKIYLQEAKKGVKFTGSVIKPGRIYAGNNTVGHLYSAIRRWNNIEKPTQEDSEMFVRRINSLFGILRRRNSYAIRCKMWQMIRHKDKIFCRNMNYIKLIKSSNNGEGV